MGIKGLIPFVENATSPGHVKQFEGQRVAIDVSCLLHRGVFGCVDQIAQNIKTDFCIRYVKKFVDMFLHHRCKITLVFDGQPLPAKKEVNDSRKLKRDSNKQLGITLLNNGMKSEAIKVFRQGIGVPKEIIQGAIKYFSAQKGINVVVAPYEADAQLAYLIQEDFVDVVVTQDSDLIVFNCKKIIFKLEISGSCMVFDGSRLSRCFARPLCDKFNFDAFRRMCILSGCDYLDGGLPGVGLKKAEKFFAKTTLTDPEKFLPRVPSFLNLKCKVDQPFIQEFIRAEHTFRHQIVYNPKLKIQLPLTLYPNTELNDYLNLTDELTQLSKRYWFAGNIVSSECATQLATGRPSSGMKRLTSFFASSQHDEDIQIVEAPPAKRTMISSAPPTTSSAMSTYSISRTSPSKRLSLSTPTPPLIQKRLSVEVGNASSAKRRLVLGNRNNIITIPDDMNNEQERMLHNLAKIGNGRLFDTGSRRSAPAKITFTKAEVNIPGLVTRPFNFPPKKRQTQKSALFADGTENQNPSLNDFEEHQEVRIL